jgi:hypothetical protein
VTSTAMHCVLPNPAVGRTLAWRPWRLGGTLAELGGMLGAGVDLVPLGPTSNGGSLSQSEAPARRTAKDIRALRVRLA